MARRNTAILQEIRDAGYEGAVVNGQGFRCILKKKFKGMRIKSVAATPVLRSSSLIYKKQIFSHNGEYLPSSLTHSTVRKT